MKDVVLEKTDQKQNQTHKSISLVILRLEIDDINYDLDSSDIHHRLHTNLAFHSHRSKSPLLTQIGSSTINNAEHLLLEQYSEKFDNKLEALKLFIGKRQSVEIVVESFDFINNMSSGKSSPNRTSQSKDQPSQPATPQQFVPNAMTMQTALETAYSDWNKEKESVKPECSKLVDEAEIVQSGDNSDNTVAKSGNNSEKSPAGSSKSESVSLSKISFFYGNPTVDIVKGVMHIYKDSNLIQFDYSEEETQPQPQQKPGQSNMPPISQRSQMLAMIGIPGSMNGHDLLDFLMPFSESLEYMRIIRDSSPSQYMALLKFKSQKEADQFYVYQNNKPFNSIEDFICHLVFVERIEVMTSSKGAPLPIPGYTELPTCYICLERMDESLNGVITILCNHSFHSNCLSKWGDTCCPVCRYTQTPEFTLDNTCGECGSHENLWICLICGHVGCGRYVRGHAYNHFQLTQHTYSMQLGNNRVWDYAADNYVHRLIQNKADGKMVQLDESGRRVANQDEKLDSITLEYTYLLTNQLESQRAYFEERMTSMEEKYEKEVREWENRAKKSEQECEGLRDSVNLLVKEKTSLEKKCNTLSSKLTKIQSELDEEKELNKCLTSNQEAYQSKLTALEDNVKKLSKEKDQEIDELKSQLRDIMFYLDAQNKFAASNEVSQEELQQSHLLIAQQENDNASGSTPTSKTRRNKKK